MTFNDFSKTSTCLLLFQLLFFGPLARSAEPPTAPANKKVQNEVIAKLASQKFFKDAKCSDFASFILKQNGLPTIGGNEPIQGMRTSVDRRNENKNPPIFSDEVIFKQQPLNSVKIAGKALPGGQWSLTLNQDFVPPPGTLKSPQRVLHLETNYFFKIEYKHNADSCELASIGFEASSPGEPGLKQTMSMSSCLDLFLGTEPQSFLANRLAQASMEQVKKACAIGLHYFIDAKAIVMKPK